MSYRVLQYIAPHPTWTLDSFETELKAKRFVRQNLDKGYEAVGYQSPNGSIETIAVYSKNTKKWNNYSYK